MQGSILKETREDAGVGQAHAAYMLGITGPVLSAVENDKIGSVSDEFTSKYLEAMRHPTPCFKRCGCRRAEVRA